MMRLIINALLPSVLGVRQLILKSGSGFATEEDNNMSAYRKGGGLRRFMSGQLSPESQTWRLLVLGDSIVLGLEGFGTRDQLCSFRCSLWEELTEKGYTVEMLGSQVNGLSDLPLTAKCHEGHDGWSMDSFGFQEHYKEGIEQFQPDIVLSNIGHNEVYSTICQQGGWGGTVLPGEAAEAAFTNLSQYVVIPLCESFPGATIIQSVILADNRNQGAGPAPGPQHSCHGVVNENPSGSYIHDTIKELNNLMRSRLPSCNGRAHLADFYPAIQFCNEAVGCHVHPNQNQYDELGRAYADLTEAIMLDPAAPAAASSS